MSDISNKAEEIAGRAKQAAGDLTGSAELQAEGTAEQARAQVKQGVDAVADKSQEAADTISAAASNGAEAVDSRVVIAVIAGLAVVVTLVVRRNRSTKARANKHPVAKKVAAAGIARALTR